MRTWKFPVTQPKTVSSVVSVQLYSLFRREGKRFVRVSNNSFTHELAFRVWAQRVFQHNLFIRPIVIECDKVEGITHFSRVHFHQRARKQFGVSNR